MLVYRNAACVGYHQTLMRTSRFLEYDTPLGPPLPRRHSFYGIAAGAFALFAMTDLIALRQFWIPEPLAPLAMAAAAFSSAAAISASGAAALDQTAKQVFVWIGAGLTAFIPLAAAIASGFISRWMESFMPR
jgi:hypothetical protein